VGPEGFSQIAPIALSDGDALWAHNGFLQFGAETGIPGMGMLVAAFVALFATFARRGGGDALTVLGAAALAAFGIGASVDYLMHFPAVPLVTAALAGTAASRNNT
jgi:O-antigen ligase